MKTSSLTQLWPSKVQNQHGSTLIELLIAATITVTVMTAIAITMMYSVQREAQNRYQESAVMLAQNAVDLLLTERAELGWDGFVSKFNPADYCLNRSGTPAVDVLEAKGAAVACPSTSFGGLAFQTLIQAEQVQPPSANKMDITITVDWIAGKTGSQYILNQSVYKGIY